MSVLAVFMGLLTVFLSGSTVLLCLFVFSLFVMMHGFAVVMGRRLVMTGCIVVGLTCGMFHGHNSCPFEKARYRQAIVPFGKTSRNAGYKSGVMVPSHPLLIVFRAVHAELVSYVLLLVVIDGAQRVVVTVKHGRSY